MPRGLVLMCLLLAAGGCATDPPALDPARRPGDFTLRLTVRPAVGTEPPWPSPLHRPGQYLVTPDRELRVALGPGAMGKVYPRRTAVLHPRDVDRLWALTHAAWREAEAGDAPALGPSTVVEATVIADGHRLRLASTLDRPAARALVRRLVRLRGGELEPTDALRSPLPSASSELAMGIPPVPGPLPRARLETQPLP